MGRSGSEIPGTPPGLVEQGTPTDTRTRPLRNWPRSKMITWPSAGQVPLEPRGPSRILGALYSPGEGR